MKKIIALATEMCSVANSEDPDEIPHYAAFL